MMDPGDQQHDNDQYMKKLRAELASASRDAMLINQAVQWVGVVAVYVSILRDNWAAGSRELPHPDPFIELRFSEENGPLEWILDPSLN